MTNEIPRQMRAAVIVGPRRAEVRLIDTPAPGPGQVLVQVEGCGVCGSNLPLWEGRPWFGYPSAPGNPGHEGWGRVAAIGRGVQGVAPGDRVAFLSERAFAEYDLASADALVTLPAALDGRDVPGEPLGCAMNIWARADVRPGHTVAVIGVGFLGAMLVRLAAAAGARVIAISQRPWSLELARRVGGGAVIDTIALDDDVVAIATRVEDAAGAEGCDRVIEAVGLQRALDVATRIVRVRGRLVIAGFHQDGPRTIDMFQWNWRGIDVINAHERDPRAYVAGMRQAVDAIAAGQLDPTPLLTHRVPLDEVAAALELLRTRPDGFVKAVVTP